MGSPRSSASPDRQGFQAEGSHLHAIVGQSWPARDFTRVDDCHLILSGVCFWRLDISWQVSNCTVLDTRTPSADGSFPRQAHWLENWWRLLVQRQVLFYCKVNPCSFEHFFSLKTCLMLPRLASRFVPQKPCVENLHNCRCRQLDVC